jgi:hypothetical protein
MEFAPSRMPASVEIFNKASCLSGICGLEFNVDSVVVAE